MLALQVIASHSWKLRSFDIKAAFLQGQPQADRIIAVDPVPELRKALNLRPQEICRLNKSAYGLVDAPYLWYCSLIEELGKLGFETSPFDPCCFVLRTWSGDRKSFKLEGILGFTQSSPSRTFLDHKKCLRNIQVRYHTWKSFRTPPNWFQLLRAVLSPHKSLKQRQKRQPNDFA